MKCYLLAKIGAGGAFTPQAICATEDAARAAAVDGAYLIVPVTVGELYDTLLDPGLPGAVVYDKEGLATLINKARQAIENLSSELGDFKTLTNSRFQQVQTAVQDLQARVAALEA